jgi:hypothetical protein
MCWKCQELDTVIGHYRDMSARTSDRLSQKCLLVLIERLEGNKKGLHQEEK